MSATFRCRAWRMSPLCARRTRMRKSPRLTADAAKKAPGVIAVVTGAELAKVMTPWVGVLTHLKGLKSAPQPPIAVDRACWQGEAVCAVVARTRAQAEDACELVEIDYQPLPAVTDPGNRARPQDAGDPFRRSATIFASNANSTSAPSTRPSRNPTPSSRPPSCSAATPASPPSRAPSSPTGTRAISV